MSFSYTAGASDRDNVRLIIGDVTSDGALFQDEELDAFLGMVDGQVNCGAAMALRTIASSQALLLRSIQVLDIKTEPAQLASVLQNHAQSLCPQLSELLTDDPADDEDDAGFEIAEQVLTVPGWRQQVWNERLRGRV